MESKGNTANDGRIDGVVLVTVKGHGNQQIDRRVRIGNCQWENYRTVLRLS